MSYEHYKATKQETTVHENIIGAPKMQNNYLFALAYKRERSTVIAIVIVVRVITSERLIKKRSNK